MRMNPLQAGWLMLESKATPMHMGSLLYFQLPKNASADAVRKLVAQLREQSEAVAPWNLRLRRRGVLGADWQVDEQFDLDYHLRHSALPAPGGERQIGELVSRLHSHPMDLSKPPWEMHLIEGLHGGRFAIYLKVHPIMLDGHAAIRALHALASGSRQRQVRALWTQSLGSDSRGRGLLDEWPALLRAGRQHLRSGLSLTRAGSGELRVPRSALNDRLSQPRRFATQQYPVARLQQLGEQLGVDQEELLYYLISSALRRFFREYNALPSRSMVALLADRTRSDGLLSPLLFALGTEHADRAKRLKTIRDGLRRARRQFSVLRPADARAEGALDALPYMLRQMLNLDHRLPPLFNVGLAALDLGERPLYLGQNRLDGIFPMPMLLQGGALNIACMRYAGHWHVGLCGARDRLPHLQRMAVYMGLSLDELEAMVNEQAA